ncbi:MAG: hypothetical protein QW197_01535 [Candidatus Aenigmatarchaeota archaeon]
MITQASLLFKEAFPEVINFFKNFFEDLPRELKVLKYKENVEIYISKAILFGFLGFVFSMVFSSILLMVLTQNIIFSLTSSILLSIFISFLIFFIYIKLPSMRIRSLASSIESELHESLYTFSVFVNDKTPLGISIKNFVASNPQFKLSKELNDILKLMEFGGLDILSAIDKKIELVPSKKLERFLFGLSTTIKAGGSLKAYVSSFARDEIEEYRNKIRESGRKVAMVLQIHMIVILVGAMFLNILISIFSLLQPMPGIVETQFLLSFLIIPIASFMIAKLIRIMIP